MSATYRVHRATASSGAIATTVAPGYPWQLHEIRVHFDAGGAATALTATMDAGAGAVYDTVIYSNSMSGVSDLIKTYDPPLMFAHPSDELDIAYANGSSAAYGIEVLYRPLG
jgi:hypothetical protein